MNNLILCVGDVTQINFLKEMQKVGINYSLKVWINLPHQGACCCILCTCPVVKILRIHTTRGNTSFSSLSAVGLQKPLEQKHNCWCSSLEAVMYFWVASQTNCCRTVETVSYIWISLLFKVVSERKSLKSKHFTEGRW